MSFDDAIAARRNPSYSAFQTLRLEPAGIAAQREQAAASSRWADGDPASRGGQWPYGIVSGRVEISSVPASGRRFIRRIGEPGQIWGFVGVFDGKGSPYFYIAQEPSWILFVPKACLIRVLRSHPAFWLVIARQLSTIHRSTLADIEELLFSDLRPRVLRILRSLGDAYGAKHGDHVVIKITQEELAVMVGVTRQSISKELAHFEQQRLIAIGYGKITLLTAAAIDRVLAL